MIVKVHQDVNLDALFVLYFRSPYRLRFIISPFQGLGVFCVSYFVALTDYAV